MKKIYIDARCGVSGDMLLHALMNLTDAPEAIRMWLEEVEEKVSTYGSESHDHSLDSHSHRSYREVRDIIRYLDLDREISKIAYDIYAVIAEAESEVHASPIDDLHFHEVGRNQAIVNIVGVALCISELKADEILCSKINDGRGKVKCAHGELDIPVPAVRSMLKRTDLEYSQTDMDGEMVTPSGLAMLIGIGAVTADMPETEPYRRTEVSGSRSAEGQGMKAFLFEV